MSQPLQGRRRFLAGIGAVPLVGTAWARGRFLPESVPLLKGERQSVVIPTHEHFGDLEERLDCPRAWEIHVQEMAGHDAPVLGRDELRRRLQNPIGTRPLREIAAGKKHAVITFDDLTRPTPTFEAAPLIVEELRAAGVPEEGIVFMGSYGTHRNLEQDEVVRKLGVDVTRRYAWINHNTFENLKDVGETTYKNRIKINQTFLAADIKITISGVKIHPQAGYGGGAKAVMPGVAHVDTIAYNHLVLGKDNKTKGRAKVFKNEVRLDMEEAARLAGTDFSVQLVYNGRRKVCGLFAGDIVAAHRAACRLANRHYRTPTFRGADIVVANGYPQNAQATSALRWINTSMREGGTGVLVIQHPQGLSAWHFLNERLFGHAGQTHFDMPGGWSEGLLPNRRLIIFSQYLDKQQMNHFPAGTLFAWKWEEVLAHLGTHHKGDARVAVYPYACIQHEEIDLDEA